MTSVEAIRRIKQMFVQEHPSLSQDDVELIFSKAFDYYTSIAFPFEHDIETLPEDRTGDAKYILMIMRNIVDRPENTAFRSYSENGMSYTLDGTIFDNKIARMIIPKGKVI